MSERQSKDYLWLFRSQQHLVIKAWFRGRMEAVIEAEGDYIEWASKFKR